VNAPTRILIVTVLAALVAIAVTLKERGFQEPTPASSPSTTGAPLSNASNEVAPSPAGVATKRPRLVDLGAEKCIPCKMMAPILAELKRDYSQHFTTDFIDIWKNPDAGEEYAVEMIPTQIFYDRDGKELFRHVGFYGKEDILAQWKTLGIDLGSAAAPGSVRE
jgi:thioredoxin 1